MGYDLYVITDAGIGRGRSHAEQAGLAVEGGADVVQLRDKALAPRDLLAAARAVRAVTRAAGALFIVNDHLEVALSAGADASTSGRATSRWRRRGRSSPPTSSWASRWAMPPRRSWSVESGADYVALSPTFSTGSKADAGPGRGLDTLRAVRAAVPDPVARGRRDRPGERGRGGQGRGRRLSP